MWRAENSRKASLRSSMSQVMVPSSSEDSSGSSDSEQREHPPPAMSTKTTKPPRGGSEIQQAHMAHSAKVRKQISKFFGQGDKHKQPERLTPISPSSELFDPLQEQIEPYTLDIICTQLITEGRNYIFTPTPSLERQLGKRLTIVNWIKIASQQMKLIPQTQHIAVYIADAYLRIQDVPGYSIELLGAVCVLIAAKQEETDSNITPAKMARFCTLGMNINPKRLALCEAKVLTQLGFKTHCPTSQFFMEACASQMTFANSYVKTYAKVLAEKMLLDCLNENSMIYIPNSKKARAALYFACKYVFYNYDLLRARDKTDKTIWEKFSQKCYPEFKYNVETEAKKRHRDHCPAKRPKRILHDITNTCPPFKRA